MKTLIIILFALKPLTFWHVDASIFGLNLFEVAAIAMNALLVLAILNGMISSRFSFVESSTDLAILFFIVWCALLLVHPDTILKEVVRLILPLFNFIVICRYFKSKKFIVRLLFWVLVGFSVPIVASAVYTFIGGNIHETNYWTGIERYRGVFVSEHTMGLSMAMYIMVLVIYFVLAERWGQKTTLAMKIIFVCLALLALYCTLESIVRTAYLTIIVFFGIFLWFRSKLVLLFASLLVVIMAIIYIGTVQLVLFDIIDATKETGDIEQAGSGRIWIWKHKLEAINSNGLGAWVYGVGIGNIENVSSSQTRTTEFDSHNDYLSLVVNTGIIGFLIYLTITVLMFKKAMKLPVQLRYVFLAYMIGIATANFVSNSFIGRFGLAQLYMMVMGVMYSIASIERKERYKAIRSAVSTEQLKRVAVESTP